MARITVLGGSGTVGSIAVRTLASFPDFSKIVIGDINVEKANELASEIGSDKVSVVKTDATDPESIKNAIKDSDVVLNCVGPFYRFAKPILKATIEARKNYVDICDDIDATQQILGLDEIAKKSDISALIGMGSSPGAANLLVKFATDALLDETDSIDIYHAHGGEPDEGVAVVAHRIHSMSIDIPMFLDGELKTVTFFGDDGKALEEEIDFHLLGRFRVYPYPHPETITLPTYIKGVKQVTNKGLVIPLEYYQLIMKLVEIGLTNKETLTVKGQTVSPHDFAIAFILEQREKILQETNFGIQRGCLKIVLKGKKQGTPHQYVFSLASRGQSMGEGTGIPAALGAILMIRGQITEKGVLPPEACVNPLEFLALMQDVLGLENVSGGDSPLIVESIDEHGNVERISL